jgi:DNA-binding transcriptional LysR family regulator
MHIVPQLVGNLRARYADIRVELTEVGTAAQLAAGRSGQIDIAISCVMPAKSFNRSSQRQSLYSLPRLAIIDLRHPAKNASDGASPHAD